MEQLSTKLDHSSHLMIHLNHPDFNLTSKMKNFSYLIMFRENQSDRRFRYAIASFLLKALEKKRKLQIYIFNSKP